MQAKQITLDLREKKSTPISRFHTYLQIDKKITQQSCKFTHLYRKVKLLVLAHIRIFLLSEISKFDLIRELFLSFT